MLAHPANAADAALLQCGNNFRSRRFQGLFFLPQPHGFHYVPRDALGQPASNGFDLRKFRHERLMITEACWTHGRPRVPTMPRDSPTFDPMLIALCYKSR